MEYPSISVEINRSLSTIWYVRKHFHSLVEPVNPAAPPPEDDEEADPMKEENEEEEDPSEDKADDKK